MFDNNSQGEVITTKSSIYSKTFFLMFLGLLATGFISWYTYSSGFVNNMSNGTFNLLLILELVVVFVFSLFFKKLPYVAVEILFFVYAIINGITLSTIFAVFQLNSITIVFFASAVLFGIFAIYGAYTKIDLSKISTILYGAIFIGIIVSIINMFVGNSLVDIILSWVMLLVFFGVTAYDMQRVKNMSMLENIESDKLYVYMAMELYLDFINIFLRVLSISGKRK